MSKERLGMACLLLAAVLTSGLLGYVNGPAVPSTNTETQQPAVTTAPGYQVQLLATELNAPVGVAVTEAGAIYIAEAGTSPNTRPRVIRLEKNGRRTVVADDFPAKLTGLTWHEGKLYVSYAGGVNVLDPKTGAHHPILAKLPALGDHPNHGVTMGVDKKLYFGLGTATNAGVVGADNIDNGWVEAHPDVRDIPCKDLLLRGVNFSIADPRTPDEHDRVATGAFLPLGKTTARLQVAKGAFPCTGAVLRANLDGSDLELVAWGLRNPVSLAFGPDGQLYATMQGFDNRGSRPVVGDSDYLYRILPDRWYGWPDFAGGRSIEEEEFQSPAMPVTPLLAKEPEQPPAPIATFAEGASPSGMLFPPDRWDFQGDALVALSGHRQPLGPEEKPEGHSLVRVNPRSGEVTPFAWNEVAAPDSQGTTVGFERPYALASHKNAVYVTDLGQIRFDGARGDLVAGTGALWVITPKR